MEQENKLLADLEYNDDVLDEFIGSLDQLVGRKEPNNEQKNYYKQNGKYNKEYNEKKLGVFSDLLSCLQVKLYDHPQFVKDYPHGFFTENIIFTPLSQYQELVAKEEAYISHGKQYFRKLDGILHVNNLIALIEHHFNVKFSLDEKKSMLSDTYIHRTYASEEIRNDVITHPPVFLSSDDLITKMKENNINQVSQEIVAAIGKEIDTINDILFKSRDVHNPAHPLHQLANKVIENQNQISIENMDVEKFKEIYNDGWSPAEVRQGYEILNELVKQAIQNTEGDQYKLVDELSKQWMPCIEYLCDTHFKVALEDLGERCKEEFGDVSSQIREELASKIYALPTTSVTKRSLLISSITDFSMMAENHVRPNEMNKKILKK